MPGDQPHREPAFAPHPEVPRRRRSIILRFIRFPLVLALGAVTLRLFGCADRLFFMPVREALTPPPNAIEVTFESDGRTLHGWFFPAPGVTADNPGPAVVHCHGNAGNMRDHAAFASFLPAAGVSVLMFDYRGYGQSERGPLRREGLVEDTLAAVAHARALPEVDPDRVGLYGVSLGGSIAIAAAVRDERVPTIATATAFSSWKAVAGDTLPVIGRWVVGPGIDAEHLVKALGRRPLLVAHGTADSIVPVYHAERIAEAARGAGVDVEVRTYDGASHNAWPMTHPDMTAAIAAFLVRTLAIDTAERSRP